MPDAWESYLAVALSAGTALDPEAFNFGDGYTNLVHYFSGLNPIP